MVKEIKKLYKGMVEIRHYDAEECIKRKKHFTIKHAGDQMTLSPEELIEKRVSVSKAFVSHIPGARDYNLWGYIWEPDEVTI